MFEGVEYDHVFHIDIDEGVVLKLPYNNGQDPFRVAQDFIYKHQLPQDYLEQIATFITQNSSRPVTWEQGTSCDPLTGGSAYVSGSGGVRTASFTNGGSDPFTGNSAYSTSNGDGHPQDYYPQSDILKFSSVKTIIGAYITCY